MVKYFLDNLGEFTKIRNELLNYYPEPMRQNKIATRLMNISQHGQYNYTRCLKRNDLVAANQCLYLFVDEVIHLVFYWIEDIKFSINGLIELY